VCLHSGSNSSMFLDTTIYKAPKRNIELNKSGLGEPDHQRDEEFVEPITIFNAKLIDLFDGDDLEIKDLYLASSS
jgi:hypothetical protein